MSHRPTLTEPVSEPLMCELQMWRFTRSLESIFESLGDGQMYYNRTKNLAEARNLLDRWLLSFQMDYRGQMDKQYPIFPENLREKDPVNQKLIDECVEKKFSSDHQNAADIFRELRKKVKKFQSDKGAVRRSDRFTVEYFEDANDQEAEIRLDDFKTERCHRVMFLVRNFGLLNSARMLMRYESLGTGSLQWGDPITVHNALYKYMGVKYEGFASPLNSKMLGKEGAHFCSLFFDTDEVFGSLGNFFAVDFFKHPGGWTVNPPFIESLMEEVAEKVMKHVSEDTKGNNWFFVTFPRWTDTPGWEKLDKFKHKIDQLELYSGDFTVQCCYGRVFPPRNDLTIFIVGQRLPKDASIDRIRRIFLDTDTEYIKQEWLKNCQIRMESAAQQPQQKQQEEEVKTYQPVEPYRPYRQLVIHKRRVADGAAKSQEQQVKATERSATVEVSEEPPVKVAKHDSNQSA